MKRLSSILLFSCIFISLFSASKELPVSSFSQLPQYNNPKLSPSGHRIAYIGNFRSPDVAVLTMFDLSTGEKKYIAKSDNEEVKINWFNWANEKTIIVSLRFASKRGGVDTTETRLIAYNIEGDEVTQKVLIKPRGSSQNVSQFQDNVISYLPDDPDHILVALDLDVRHQPSVYKVNINTTRKKRIEKGKLWIRDWLVDQQGKLRVGISLNYETGEASTRVRIGDNKKWHSIFEYNAFNEPAITPLGFGLDPNLLYYRAYKGDKLALFTLDLKTKEERLIFEDKNYDVDGRLIYSKKSKDVIGVYHGNSETGRIYWSGALDSFQKSINTALPDTNNYLVDFSTDENIYVLYTENGYTPGVYFLGNRKEKSLDLLFEQYPNLSPDELTAHQLITYTARDGEEIEGYLTIPKGLEGKALPTILHPHGGPGSREYAGFDYWTSFFTNRGYAVFRPNFRGSTGYGYEFAQSQMKGWGLTMQDDLTDAAHWLIDKGIADPKRICIVGASYGGYAATMAAVKTPNLFKCAISFAGISNLRQLVGESRNYINSKFVENQIGDKTKDLKARSPYYHAEKIVTPLLLIHGEQDRVVDVKQSRMMAKKLKSLDKPVTYIELEDGDHYLSIQRNRDTTFSEMDSFLKKHLK
ncbi:S9 family peptidase [Alteromonadaceae bacterium M269]|nr:S9 family peptidase [Alteromonadaceae bacterium M269]